jgi:hypothetical protein
MAQSSGLTASWQPVKVRTKMDRPGRILLGDFWQPVNAILRTEAEGRYVLYRVVIGGELVALRHDRLVNGWDARAVPLTPPPV